jgi:hypothetical protein
MLSLKKKGNRKPGGEVKGRKYLLLGREDSGPQEELLRLLPGPDQGEVPA